MFYVTSMTLILILSFLEILVPMGFKLSHKCKYRDIWKDFFSITQSRAKIFSKAPSFDTYCFISLCLFLICAVSWNVKSPTCHLCSSKPSAPSEAACLPHRLRTLCFHHNFLLRKTTQYRQISHSAGIQLQTLSGTTLRNVWWWLLLSGRLING